MKTPLNYMGTQNFAARKRRLVLRAAPLLALIAAALLAGCESPVNSRINQFSEPAAKTAAAEVITLREGDVLKVSFPGSPTLDTTQEIRRDGKITLPLVGEVDAAGITPLALETKLMDLYAPQLSTKQVVVEVTSSSFPIYVTGMVLHPGKILTDHPITALEAVMEAGGFDYARANLKNVTVIRREKNVMKNYKLNLKAVLEGRQSESFELKPDDIIYVPERFSMF